jgi:hypothetical protein
MAKFSQPRSVFGPDALTQLKPISMMFGESSSVKTFLNLLSTTETRGRGWCIRF